MARTPPYQIFQDMKSKIEEMRKEKEYYRKKYHYEKGMREKDNNQIELNILEKENGQLLIQNNNLKRRLRKLGVTDV